MQFFLLLVSLVAQAATLDVTVPPEKIASLRLSRSMMDGKVKRQVLVETASLPSGSVLRVNPAKPLLYRWFLSAEGKIVQSSMPYFEAEVISVPASGSGAGAGSSSRELAGKYFVHILELDSARIVAAVYRDPLPKGAKKITYPLLWSAHNPLGTWAHAVEQAVRSSSNRWLRDNPPRDMRDFCPRFESLGSEKRELFWIALLNLITRYESAYIPLTASDEGQYDSGNKGVISSGLTQISLASSRASCYQERGCSVIRGQGDLFRPEANLRCAVGVMSCLAESGDCLSCKRGGSWQGIARYWSTMRDPYVINCPSCPGGKITIGKKPKILELLRSTADFCF